MIRIVRPRGTPSVPSLRRRASRAGRIAVVAALLATGTGVQCNPGAIRVVNRPPDPTLVDEHGEVDANGFDALVAAVEEQRGLRFIQRPRLELASADDPRLPALRAAARALEACPAPESATSAEAPPAGICFADPGLEFAICLAPPDLASARRVVGRLLDAQNYPRLAGAAPLLPGDPGVAIRALLAASAGGARPPAALAESGDVDFRDLLDLPEIEVDAREAPGDGCVELASAFLAVQSDREASFRTPPLSTKMLASPKAYRASERPHLLAGAPPDIADCQVASDESFGVARILVALLAKGGSIPGPALAAWQGDRALRFACARDDAPWIYVAELSDETRAKRFATSVPRALLAAFPGRAETQRVGRRVVTAHGFDAAHARAWTASLTTQELVRFDGLP